MRVLVQRVRSARVDVDGETVGEIGRGLLLLVGVTHTDTAEDARYLAQKVAHLRIFEDGQQKMGLSVLDVGGAVLSVSQFTLYGDARRGRRPDFTRAARPEPAREIYEQFNRFLEEQGLTVATGRFGAMMQVHLINDGPVTLLLEHPPLKSSSETV